jgi:dihydrolipoamide dehydrogenase
MAECDVLVIGAGPGGYPAAIRAAQLGMNVICVEKELLGGVCLNWGCIPSKALLKTAEFAYNVKEASEWGLSIPEHSIDMAAVVKRSRKVSKKFERGVGGLFKKYGVTSMFGTATLIGNGQVSVQGKDGAQTVTAKHIIVATGARARTFPGIEADGERILTYREAIVADDKPESAVIVGSGAIGMEFAYFWRGMGVDVTVVEGLNEILPLEDPDCAAEARKQLAKKGIDFKLGVFVDSVGRDGESCITTLKDGTILKSDKVLLALGITPNVQGIGLEAVGVKTGRGGIEVDASHQTNVAGIYAIGDVCSSGPALAHTAMRQAHVVVERIAGLHVPDVNYGAMPSCTYCQPQVASVGLTEAQATEQGLEFDIGLFPFQANGKAVGARHGEGFTKVLVGKQYGEILGAHIVGAGATEMIAEFVLAMTSESTATLIAETVHAHPTYSEVALEAVANALGISVHI